MIYKKGVANYYEPTYTDLRQMFQTLASDFGDYKAYAYRLKPKSDTIYKTYTDLYNDINCLGSGINALSLLQTDEKACIIGDNSYAWAVAHIAVILNSAVSVPLDKNLEKQEIISLCERSKSRIIFCDLAYIAVAETILQECKNVHAVIILHKPEDSVDAPTDNRFFTFKQILELGKAAISQGNTDFMNIPLDADKAAGLYFTSGTTSESKGVLLSQNNIMTNFRNGTRSLYSKPGINILSILPMHHTFENTVGMFAQLAHHNCIYFNDGLRYFVSNLKEWEIECILAVPLLLESIYGQIMHKLKKNKKLRLIKILLFISNFLYSLGLDLRRKIFKKILDQFGGKLCLIIAGAAAIDNKIIKFFNDIGIDCMLGYGLTEAGPMLTANTQKFIRLGSVGTPLADHEIKIDNGLAYSDANHTGEVLGKSAGIMLGYYENPEATEAAIDRDGWLHTGDVGYLDKDGFLFLTGRLKSMIVHTNGKKVFPEELESVLQHIDGIKSAFVWGEKNHRGNYDICASVQVDLQTLGRELKNTDDEAVSAWIQTKIDELNLTTPAYKLIRYFIWCEKGMPVSTTLKVRRQLEMKRIRTFLKNNGQSIREANRHKIS